MLLPILMLKINTKEIKNFYKILANLKDKDSKEEDQNKGDKY